MTPYDRIRQVAQVMLKGLPELTPAVIREQIQTALRVIPAEQAATIDTEQMAREFEANFNVSIGRATVLEDPKGHKPWLAARRAEIQWRSWEAYRLYLEQEAGWAPQTLDRHDELTDMVLERLEDPRRPGRWDRRGMVVGHIQSGKTASYIGLICKAIDAGYKLVVVLAGLNNDLRSQTQLRVDEGLLGWDTRRGGLLNQENSWIGVGLLGGIPSIHPLTSSAEDGDFKRHAADTVGAVPGSDPIVLVVKKYGTVLDNLISWATYARGHGDPETGHRVVAGVPLLVIDDEADHASVNTKVVLRGQDGSPISDQDPAAINRRIRRLLRSFEQSAYVGYTATPFANIFIPPKTEAMKAGEDLFPRSFIINLPAPSNYVGPVRVFGLDADPDNGQDQVDGLPVVRTVDDYGTLIPNKHKPDHVVDELPPSLIDAIHSFVLASAARLCRGQGNRHNSMLVHVTRYNAVQQQVAELVQEEVRDLRRQLQFRTGKPYEQLMSKLRSMWQDDFAATTAAMNQSDPDLRAESPAWPAIREQLHAAAARIEVRTVNGMAKDVLAYRDHPEGLWVIAIGGDKLSRGLTLEGLSTSYFLRASSMYDTLMQMGRWFGYRPGYLDLCRLYTSDELVEWYRYVAAASEELREEFDQMAALELEPVEYGLKVAKHPGGLLITAMNKMRAAATVEFSYSQRISESLVFDKDPDVVRHNLNALATFIRDLPGEGDHAEGKYLWRDIPVQAVVEFLRNLRTYKVARTARTSLLTQYICEQAEKGELTSWSVALISRKDGTPAEIGGRQVGLTQRTPQSNPADHASLKRLVSPRDEMLDLSEAQRSVALELTQAHWRQTKGSGEEPDIPSGFNIRGKRSPGSGLLLLYPLDPEPFHMDQPLVGFAVSFPKSETAKAVSYAVNEIFSELELDPE